MQEQPLTVTIYFRLAVVKIRDEEPSSVSSDVVRVFDGASFLRVGCLGSHENNGLAEKWNKACS